MVYIFRIETFSNAFKEVWSVGFTTLMISVKGSDTDLFCICLASV